MKMLIGVVPLILLSSCASQQVERPKPVIISTENNPYEKCTDDWWSFERRNGRFFNETASAECRKKQEQKDLDKFNRNQQQFIDSMEKIRAKNDADNQEYRLRLENEKNKLFEAYKKYYECNVREANILASGTETPENIALATMLLCDKENSDIIRILDSEKLLPTNEVIAGFHQSIKEKIPGFVVIDRQKTVPTQD